MRNVDLHEQEYDLIMSLRNYRTSVNKSSYLKRCLIEDFKDLIENADYFEDEN